MMNDVETYTRALSEPYQLICRRLQHVIEQVLTTADAKVWHGSPVWFIAGNPIVGYSVRKRGVQLLFWSGQSFLGTGLEKEGSFMAAHKYYESVSDVKVTALRRWLKSAKKIQWDYKNIVKNKGKLNKIGTW